MVFTPSSDIDQDNTMKNTMQDAGHQHKEFLGIVEP